MEINYYWWYTDDFKQYIIKDIQSGTKNIVKFLNYSDAKGKITKEIKWKTDENLSMAFLATINDKWSANLWAPMSAQDVHYALQIIKEIQENKNNSELEIGEVFIKDENLGTIVKTLKNKQPEKNFDKPNNNDFNY